MPLLWSTESDSLKEKRGYSYNDGTQDAGVSDSRVSIAMNMPEWPTMIGTRPAFGRRPLYSVLSTNDGRGGLASDVVTIWLDNQVFSTGGNNSGNRGLLLPTYSNQ